MKLPGGLEFEGLMNQAKQMMGNLQQELKQMRLEGSSGGGMVKITMTGTKELISLRIDPEICKSDDVEMLQDLIVVAFNDASGKAEEAIKGKVGGMLPPGMF